MSRDVLDPHSHRWSTVLMAPQLETFVLKATLEEEGIPCFLPDGHIKTIDPFVSGANALMHAVQVREEHLEKAREILEAVRGVGARIPGLTTLGRPLGAISRPGRVR